MLFTTPVIWLFAVFVFSPFYWALGVSLPSQTLCWFRLFSICLTMKWKNFLLDCEFITILIHVSHLWKAEVFIDNHTFANKFWALQSLKARSNCASVKKRLLFQIIFSFVLELFFSFPSLFSWQACTSFFFVRAFLPVNPQDASHPNTWSHPHHQQISGVHSWLAGKTSILLLWLSMFIVVYLLLVFLFCFFWSCYMLSLSSSLNPSVMQLLTSSPFMWLLALSGLVSYHQSWMLL